MKPEPLIAPVTGRPPLGWGSDAVAELLSRLDLPYIAMVPGSSYRGLHDSLVNYLGNTGPQLIVCLHEEHSVAIAQGYAKVTGKPMLVGLHSNVGLMHAAMAIYNAYCDRAPMVLVGATGPLDAAKRRPWIDWVHTSADQGALIRHYVKWDDQPGSVEAALESVLRGYVLTQVKPSAPVYVCLDSEIQEAPVDASIAIPDPDRYPVPLDPAPDAATVTDLVARIGAAERPLVLVGRSGRTEEEWRRRVDLVEAAGLCALTDLRMPAAFPTDHPRHPARPGAGRLSRTGLDLVRNSDLILALNWTELNGTLRAAFGDGPRPVVVNVRNVGALLNGWTKDHFATVAADLEVTAGPDQTVSALLDRVGEIPLRERPEWPPTFPSSSTARPEVTGDPILMSDLADGVVCDEFCRASAEHVFAAGDVARWRNGLFTEPMRIEHWTNAVEQAGTVAWNIVHGDRPRAYAPVPYVWSDQYGSRLQIVGRPRATDDVRIVHDDPAGSLVALYVRDGALAGAFALNAPQRALSLRRSLAARTPLDDVMGEFLTLTTGSVTAP